MTSVLAILALILTLLATTHSRLYRTFWVATALTAATGGTAGLLHHDWLAVAFWCGTTVAAGFCALSDGRNQAVGETHRGNAGA